MGIRRLLILGLAGTTWLGAPPEARPNTPPIAPPVMAVLYLEAQRIGTVGAWDGFLGICRDSPYCKLAAAERAKLLPPKQPEIAPPPPPVAAIPDELPPVAAPSAPAPEIETAEEPAAMPVPRPKPQMAKPAAKPKPEARPQPQPLPEPDYTGSIPDSATTALPGTRNQDAVRPRGLLKSQPEPEQTAGPKPKSGGAAKSTREFRRSMFPHLRGRTNSRDRGGD